MEKAYIIKGDHWQENFSSYAVFHESDSADLALLGLCLAASHGSGSVKKVDLTQWSQDASRSTLTLHYGPSGDFAIELRKKEGQVIVDLDGEELVIPQGVFAKMVAAWETAIKERPVCVEFTQEQGKYALLTSRGVRLVIE
jgi:hypothetical protein